MTLSIQADIDSNYAILKKAAKFGENDVDVEEPATKVPHFARSLLLLQAAENDQPIVVKKIMKAGVDQGTLNSALILVVRKDKRAVVEELARKVTEETRDQALIQAVIQNRANLIQPLVDARVSEGALQYALKIAESTSNVAIARLLVSNDEKTRTYPSESISSLF